jgi:hypothetical protein
MHEGRAGDLKYRALLERGGIVHVPVPDLA